VRTGQVPDRFQQWIVCLRDIPAGEDTYLGPYRTEEGAARVARKLNRDIAARGATLLYDALVEPLRSGGDLMAFREELLADLDAAGYPMLLSRTRE
jgi:hypothetical protein